MKVKVISLPYIFQVLYVLCFSRPRYQVSVYRTIGPLVFMLLQPNPQGGRRYLQPEIAPFLAHLSRRLTRWAYSIPVEPASIRALTLSNMNISTTSRPIATKFCLKHLWGGGKAALGFWPDQIGTLVSMATDCSHRVIMEKTVLPLFLSFFFI